MTDCDGVTYGHYTAANRVINVILFGFFVTVIFGLSYTTVNMVDSCAAYKSITMRINVKLSKGSQKQGFKTYTNQFTVLGMMKKLFLYKAFLKNIKK